MFLRVIEFNVAGIAFKFGSIPNYAINAMNFSAIVGVIVVASSLMTVHAIIIKVEVIAVNRVILR